MSETPTSPAEPVQPKRRGRPEESTGESGSGRFAVFNTTLEQFVGPVTTGRPEDPGALVPEGHDYEVREV